MDVVVGFASSSDAFAINALYGEWSLFSGVFPDLMIAPESSESIASNISSGSRVYVVARVSGLVVGVCYLDLSFFSLKSVRLGNMIVSKDYRRMGIGSKILDKVLEYAKREGITKVWLWTQVELRGAIACYEKFGFVREGVQKAQFLGRDAFLYGLIVE